MHTPYLGKVLQWKDLNAGMPHSEPWIFQNKSILCVNTSNYFVILSLRSMSGINEDWNILEITLADVNYIKCCSLVRR